MTPWLREPADGGRETTEPADLTVGELASLVGVSVRTLHHWDATGLVRPESRTAAGYRTYSPADVARVHRVLVYRELGFPLADIGRMLDEPGLDVATQLRRQRELIEERIARLTRMAAAVDSILSSHASGTLLTARQQAEIFGSEWREEWGDEARERWGDSPEWTQFQRNAAHASETDRARMHAAGEQLYADLAAAMRSGAAPGDDAANALAERHRELIGALFDCTHSMQVVLSRMYVDDARFTPYFDAFEPGLAPWLADVIAANAGRHGVDPATAEWE
ncbi:MerR family transcriptional regulator [Microbacterium sp. NPDC058342]|uniref:MerR family transcriptional regulator n=1 Tax=Microbacterium sp. NPDC058342 TaxID=3346454 RepID=UPI00365E7901